MLMAEEPEYHKVLGRITDIIPQATLKLNKVLYGIHIMTRYLKANQELYTLANTEQN